MLKTAAGKARPGAGESTDHPAPDKWKELLQAAIHQDPEILGYGKPFWTVPLLEKHLRKNHAIIPATRIRAALRDLGYHWKNSRYQQARVNGSHAH